MLKKLYFFVLVIFLSEIAGADIKPEILENVKKSIVRIDVQMSLAAYGDAGRGIGTGFIVDKKLGLIVTNQHVCGANGVANYFITFDTGQQIEAKLLYYDLWQDYGVLKVVPALMPQGAKEIKFSTVPPEQYQPVFMVGNNEAQEFSLQTGYLSNLYSIEGTMPQHSYIINFNGAAGSSGSPLLDKEGNILGIIYGGAKTFEIALKGEYILDAITELRKNNVPQRKHVGMLCELYSLDKAVRHRNFPKEVASEYIKKNPQMYNKVVAVKSIIKDSPAEGILNSGDILWKIDDVPITASLYTLDHRMNISKKDNVKLTIYRDGKLIEKLVNLYDINKNKITKILNFGGATFFQVDDMASSKSGIPLGTLVIANIQRGSSFSSISQYSFWQDNKENYRIIPLSFGVHKVSNIEDVIKVIPKLKKFVTFEFINAQPYFYNFNNILVTSHDNIVADIILDSADSQGKVFEFDTKELEWKVEYINTVLEK